MNLFFIIKVWTEDNFASNWFDSIETLRFSATAKYNPVESIQIKDIRQKDKKKNGNHGRSSLRYEMWSSK